MPDTIALGATTRFSVSGEYSAAAWGLRFVLNDSQHEPTVIPGVVSGTGFVVTIPANLVITPGRYLWSLVYTANGTGEVANGASGVVQVRASVLATATPTFAQKQVTTIETALARISSRTNMSASFNGQTFTSANVGDLQRQLTYWQARVIAEQRQASCESAVGGSIATEFAPVGGGPCWPRW